MAGFTINGFGASDSYYTLKQLKTARCRVCKRDTQFSLMELKMKIRLLYIPTVSIGKKYAVVCTRCKNGYYVNEEQRDFILNNPVSKISIEENGVTLHGINAQKEAIEASVVPEPPAETPQPAVQTVIVPEPPKPEPPKPEPPKPEPPKPEPVRLEQNELDSFFVKASSVEPEPPVRQDNSIRQNLTSQVNYSRRKICPSCRMMFAPDKQFCNICGSLLQLK